MIEVSEEIIFLKKIKGFIAMNYGMGLIQKRDSAINGSFVEIGGEAFYRIQNCDAVSPFFMNVVTSSNQWLFVSSTGGMTAGRINPQFSLFPYIGDDEIAANAGKNGPFAAMRVKNGSSAALWIPFDINAPRVYAITRNIYKNVTGDKLIFEEINRDVELLYRYYWRTSDLYGFVKTIQIENLSARGQNIDFVDGLRNLLPFGSGPGHSAPVVDAHKVCELDTQSGLAIYSMSASPGSKSDEPREALKASIAYQVGLKNRNSLKYLISDRQIDSFLEGRDIEGESYTRGRAGAYLVNGTIAVAPHDKIEWSIVADVCQDASAIVARKQAILDNYDNEYAELLKEISRSNNDLLTMMAQADALQNTAEKATCAHHYANVLFNTMRGGIFADHYDIEKADLIKFVIEKNRIIFEQNSPFFAKLPDKMAVWELASLVNESDVADLQRICGEYLPITFSRRHGDPSRPWNSFSINTKNSDGSKRLDFEGNWRDLFQNWEALSWSFPEFVESIIMRFLNATTADGYNPYQMTRSKTAWIRDVKEETSRTYGYWNDHQIVYLHRLMDISSSFHPNILQGMLNKKIFVHTNVPYRIRNYDDIVRNYHKTIDYDHDTDRFVIERSALIGSDGALVTVDETNIFHVNMMEKLIVLLLAKLSNLVPDGGIWMNTQKPEWNDANNALVGKGASVVTICQLHAWLIYFRDTLLKGDSLDCFEISNEVCVWFDGVIKTLDAYFPNLSSPFSAKTRREFMDEMGEIVSFYRERIYNSGFSNKFGNIGKNKIGKLVELSIAYCRATIENNRRNDGMFHSYNTISFGSESAAIGHLDEMLEGQAAVLSSAVLDSTKSLGVIKGLRSSSLYRKDQHSYILAPNKILKKFVEKNTLPAEKLADSKLVNALFANGNFSIFNRDINGNYHFNGDFHNAFDLNKALDMLATDPRYTQLVDNERQSINKYFEELFDHSKFLGRSGVMFAYEGLGSIYWHMVSKYLLAVQETAIAFREKDTFAEFCESYYDIRQGLGFCKTPLVQGAFPTDPYSYTPESGGAKQPGMTGQVKEEILSRRGEFGLFVRSGTISFEPVLLKSTEFLNESATFRYLSLNDGWKEIILEKGSLAFTFCQTPIVYKRHDSAKIIVQFASGSKTVITGSVIDKDISRQIFRREGSVLMVEVYGVM